jgi:hypothetical protein
MVVDRQALWTPVMHSRREKKQPQGKEKAAPWLGGKGASFLEYRQMRVGTLLAPRSTGTASMAAGCVTKHQEQKKDGPFARGGSWGRVCWSYDVPRLSIQHGCTVRAP